MGIFSRRRKRLAQKYSNDQPRDANGQWSAGGGGGSGSGGSGGSGGGAGPEERAILDSASSAATTFAKDTLGDDHAAAADSKMVGENAWVLINTLEPRGDAGVTQYGVIMSPATKDDVEMGAVESGGRYWMGDDINILTAAEYHAGTYEPER